MLFNTEIFHWMLDLLLIIVLGYMIYLRVQSREKNQSQLDPMRIFKNWALPFERVNQKSEYERKFLDTLKDLQDLKFALDESNIVQVVDKHANILYANEKFCQLSGYTLEELQGENMRIFNSGYHSQEYFRELWMVVSNGNVWRGDMRNKTKDGQFFWVSTTIVPFLDREEKPFQYIVIRNDITKSKENEKKLEYLSNVDGLTSLFNRRYFDQMLDYYWETSFNNKNSLSVILIDVDYFKSYNDYYGHVLGDRCLINVSIRLKELLSSYEAICARYGGEEFAIILPQKDLDEASSIVEHIRIEIEKLNIPHQMSKISRWVTMSFGVATVIPNESMKPKDLVELADKALYQAKTSGRNTVKQYA